jgi:alkyl hydroperoxide reductase subunit AhpC
MSLISSAAPEFCIPAVSIDSTDSKLVSLSDYAGSWLLLLFYPRDFSFVCPTELTSFSARAVDFERRNCSLLGLSVDPIASHVEWFQTSPAAGGIGPLQFPLASDATGDVARRYGVWLPESGVSARGLFLIDPQGILQYSVVHNLSVGRSVDEILRVLDALESGGLCPASWTAADGNIDPEAALQPGRVLGHYRIQRLLGKGTFATVFAAWDLQLERHVALKVLRRNAVESRTDVLREARVAAPLNHPNICTIYAVEELDGLPVIALELIDGGPLSKVLFDGPPDERRLELAHGIAVGLAAAHARQIAHGDLKPANVLVGRDFVPRILDFGLSRRANRQSPSREESPATGLVSAFAELPHGDMDATVSTPLAAPGSEGGISGTPAYMSPEQWRGGPATPASDMFSFGLVLFELLTNRRALPDDNLALLAARIANPRLPESLAGQVPNEFQNLLLGLLNYDPESRLTAEVAVSTIRDLIAMKM